MVEGSDVMIRKYSGLIIGAILLGIFWIGIAYILFTKN